MKREIQRWELEAIKKYYYGLRAADQQTEQVQPNPGLSCLSAAPEPDVGMRSGTARWVK